MCSHAGRRRRTHGGEDAGVDDRRLGAADLRDQPDQQGAPDGTRWGYTPDGQVQRLARTPLDADAEMDEVHSAATRSAK